MSLKGAAKLYMHGCPLQKFPFITINAELLFRRVRLFQPWTESEWMTGISQARDKTGSERLPTTPGRSYPSLGKRAHECTILSSRHRPLT